MEISDYHLELYNFIIHKTLFITYMILLNLFDGKNILQYITIA